MPTSGEAKAVACCVAASMIAKFMAMNMDEKVAQIIGRVVVSRLLEWPQQPPPEAVKDSFFNVHHAHLVLVSRPLQSTMRRCDCAAPGMVQTQPAPRWKAQMGV
jgi:hypothetical protein